MSDGIATPASNGALKVCLVGAARLVRPDGGELPLERKDAALLALLALDGALPRSRAAALLWPDTGEEQARGNLRQRIFRLRRSAGRDVVAGGAALVLASGIVLDIGELAERLAEDPQAGTGELLGGHDYSDQLDLDQWVAGARERWRLRRLELLARVASELETRRELARALPYAQRMLADDPLLEHAHRRVMRLHYLRGDRAAALAAYQRCRDALGRELNAPPGVETRQLAELIERSGVLPAPAPRPLTTLRPPKLVGREAAWRALRAALAAGTGALVLGEPGVGKTRLLQDFVAAHGNAPLVGARAGDARVPYALLARILGALVQRFGPPSDRRTAAELARFVPDLGAASTDRFEPPRLQQALALALAGWRSSGLALLAVDDLQFADDASLEMLPRLVAAAHDAGPVWLLGARAGELPVPIAVWLGAQGADAPRSIALGPLDPDGVRVLLESLAISGLDAARWAPPLLRHTGGNPLFLLETLIALLERDADALAGAPAELPAPRHVGTLIERRLAQLGHPALKLARLAAVAAPDFSIELAAGVLGQHPLDIADAWRELETALVMRDDAFAHDLIREATLRSVPQAIARTLHREVAARLQEHGAPPARVAAHWEAAGDVDAAARAFDAAAEHARARSAPREELQALDAAARCHDVAGNDAGAFQCQWRSVQLLLTLESADAALARANALRQRAASDPQHAAALEAQALVLNERYEAERALAVAREAQTLAAAAGEPRIALLAAQRAAAALMRLGRPDEAVAAQRAHLHRLDELRADERLYWLADHATALDYADRRGEALAVFDRVIDEAERIGDWSAAGEAWCNKGVALLYLGRAADSVHAAERSLACGTRAGSDAASLLIDQSNYAGALRDAGRFAEYLRIAEPLPQALRDAGHPAWAVNAENDLAVCFAWLGRPELAHRALGPLPDELPPIMRASRWFTQARLLREQIAHGGAPAPAGQAGPAQLVRQANALIESAGGSGRSYVRLKIALESARDEPPAIALERAAAIAAEALQREQFAIARHALMLRVQLLIDGDDLGTAAAAARELIDALLRDGAPPSAYPPEAWWVAHRALARTGATDDAALALHHAVQWIEQTALPQVPQVFRRSFVERNRINAAVLAAARARA